MRVTFLDIYKAFNKVWYKCLTFELSAYGVNDNVLKLLENYVTDWQQKIVRNGENSSWQIILTGVPQWSVLGSFLFLVYINDLPRGITSINKVSKISVNDKSYFSKVNDKNLSNT